MWIGSCNGTIADREFNIGEGYNKGDRQVLSQWKKPPNRASTSCAPSRAQQEQDYIEFLWDAFETNHTHGKYQFAFLAYHMLALVAANRELIARFETKIQATLARVWGEDTG